MTLIQAEDMEAIALGAAVYGTGGGGDPYLGKLLAQNTIRAHGPVRLITLDALENQDLIVPVALVGAPTVMLEKLPEIDPLVLALRRLETRLGRRAKALVSIEVGGLNSVIPFSVASLTGLPLLDGDTLGRAFPELQMSLCTLAGIGACPMALADEKGNALTVDAVDNRSAERFVRSITMDMGGASYAALYAMTATQARQALLPGTIRMTQRCGQAVFDARARLGNPVSALLQATGGQCLFEGKVMDVQRRTDGRFNRGVAQLQGLDQHQGGTLEVLFQNEFLLARTPQQVLCSTPDLIVAVDLETAEPITGEQMRYGLRVAMLGIACAPAWRTPQALDLAGPRHFGYDIDYRPLGSPSSNQAAGPTARGAP
ncbi:MAG: DUF917 domain-containing protein [Curvibacter sp.]|nr:DUF917 domain-containing protein [Curvibacter sp.]